MTTRRSIAAAWSLPAGAVLIALCEAMLLIDVQRRGGVVVSENVAAGDLPRPSDALGWAARWVAVNMTVLCWVGYLLAADGVLVLLSRPRGMRGEPGVGVASVRSRPNRFVVAWLTSIAVWCVFDWFNFYHLHAWAYHGLPASFIQRVSGYFIAFAAISPGMFLAAQIYLHLGRRPRGEGASEQRRSLPAEASKVAWWLILAPWGVLSLVVLALLPLQGGEMAEPATVLGSALLLLGPPVAALVRRQSQLTVAFAVGVAFVAWTAAARDPVSSFTMWVGLIYLLDPINAWLGGPSLLRDWQAGRLGRTAALAAAGLTCGLLWELWNYWALAKWTYDLPFLGPLEEVRYFEMPLPGLLGFIPFAGECWVMLNTIIALLERCGLRVAEPLPDDHSVL